MSSDHANVPVLPPVLFGLGLAAGFLMQWLAPVSIVPSRLAGEVRLAGIALVANTPWVLAALPPVWLALRFLVIDREEAYLERKFGDEYRSFKARTRRWL